MTETRFDIAAFLSMTEGQHFERKSLLEGGQVANRGEFPVELVGAAGPMGGSSAGDGGELGTDGGELSAEQRRLVEGLEQKNEDAP